MEYCKILETPGGTAFVRRAAQALMNGCCVSLVLPDALLNRKELLDAVSSHLKGLGGPSSFKLADCAPGPAADGLAASMAALSGTDRKRTRKPFADYFRRGESDYLKVVALRGLERLPEPGWPEAARELAAAVEASGEGAVGGSGPEGLKFLALLRPDFPGIPARRGLVTLPWWGAVSQADCDVLFDAAVEESGKKLTEWDYWWLKALAAGIGGDDPCLIGELVAREPRDMGSVRALLAAHPLSRRVPEDFEPEGEFLYPGISPARSAPPDRPRDRVFWAKGLLSPNRHTLYHPALLAARGGLLDRFVSRGQRDVIFPLVEQVHGLLLHAFERMLGGGIWEHYLKESPLQEAAEREMGPLHKAMSDLAHLLPSKDRYQVEGLKDHAYRWKMIRHQLAHSLVLEYHVWHRAVDEFLEAARNRFWRK
ncbi:MAG: hypothetical protein LBG06_07865 [Deltaproteobacteria bacterium]|jgi:hypothetical protein|nr:hypothetical protein [Deltaproteobacteria bacterium]